MNDDTMQNVDSSSTQFTEGVEAGLNSTEDSKNWKAGNELGQELKDEGDNRERVTERLLKDPSLPLFMKESEGGNKGNPQDEKDGTEE